MTHQDAELFTLEKATVARAGGSVVLRDLSWTVRAGQRWAVVGPTGSGKTTLAELLLGRHHLEAGSLGWPLLDRLRAAGQAIAWPADVVRLVSFKEESWLFSYSRHYYQERFNFSDPHDDMTLDAFLHAGTAASEEDLRRATSQLGIESLRPLSLIKLSNGQIRRARIARALLSRPELLILDAPFLGLDSAGRDEVASMLGRLAESGLPLLLITRDDAIPDWITHVLELRSGQASWQGVRHDFSPETPAGIDPVPATPPREKGEPIIELRDVRVAYQERVILRDVSWTVRQGERWAILGPNGSGKSTLLSLLCGDHPQAYANDIRLFGRQRGSGESIWDIKKRIGLVSPEFHFYFSEPLTAAQTAATGFFDVLAWRRVSAAQDRIVREHFERFGILALSDRPFRSLSTGEQRLVLLIRALVKDPPLLILDEPFQGLDGQAMRQARDWLDQHLRPEQTLLFVTHHAEELPRSVDHLLRLEQGRVSETQRSQRATSGA